jgi:thymidylate synthase (FAD)
MSDAVCEFECFEKTPMLDQGYIQLIETWGADERIVEAARMSTGKGFNGWGGECTNPDCTNGAIAVGEVQDDVEYKPCSTCGGSGHISGDEKLLAYLYNNKHSTPFEMAGLVIEVKAPIFVYREWHRHRTQSYNEMSARYIPLPDENYVPTMERLMLGANTATTNKQAQGSGVVLTEGDGLAWLAELADVYEHAQHVYERGIAIGVPKELARLPVPVARYSRMRASANLRNWLGFLTLRMNPAAQWEIRQYANAMGTIISQQFPRTWDLFTAAGNKS